MYQTLICRIVGRDCIRDQTRGLAAPLDAQLLQRAPDALVDGMGTYAEADRDFLAAVMPVNQQQAFNLTLAEAGNG
jgi:hypothetical protein